MQEAHFHQYVTRNLLILCVGSSLLLLVIITACNQCFGWKKQITRARTAAKKAGKKAGSYSSND